MKYIRKAGKMTIFFEEICEKIWHKSEHFACAEKVKIGNKQDNIRTLFQKECVFIRKMKKYSKKVKKLSKKVLTKVWGCVIIAKRSEGQPLRERNGEAKVTPTES